jgi:hypothetical protein
MELNLEIIVRYLADYVIRPSLRVFACDGYRLSNHVGVAWLVNTRPQHNLYPLQRGRVL